MSKNPSVYFLNTQDIQIIKATKVADKGFRHMYRFAAKNITCHYNGFLFTSLYSKYRDRVLPKAAYLNSILTYSFNLCEKTVYKGPVSGTYHCGTNGAIQIASPA